MSQRNQVNCIALSRKIVIKENYHLGLALFTFGKPTLSPFMFFFLNSGFFGHFFLHNSSLTGQLLLVDLHVFSFS